MDNSGIWILPSWMDCFSQGANGESPFQLALPAQDTSFQVSTSTYGRTTETTHLRHLWAVEHHTEHLFVPQNLPNSTVKPDTSNNNQGGYTATITGSVQNSGNRTPLPSSLGTPETVTGPTSGKRFQNLRVHTSY